MHELQYTNYRHYDPLGDDILKDVRDGPGVVVTHGIPPRSFGLKAMNATNKLLYPHVYVLEPSTLAISSSGVLYVALQLFIEFTVEWHGPRSHDITMLEGALRRRSSRCMGYGANDEGYMRPLDLPYHPEQSKNVVFIKFLFTVDPKLLFWRVISAVDYANSFTKYNGIMGTTKFPLLPDEAWAARNWTVLEVDEGMGDEGQGSD
ncbi:hypothetical protein NP233_g6157 [Leucocoprinus birnbaumii]|uniref:Uncharacterized protein n=1 Tax=Leucocoprinus birnbaumii TaxID=56174 RepID=A0AAD5YQ98_9AGAR|nr:hypothetical protein NP233_g6157 [Leucocoprinus birnbaumii]